MESAKWKFLPPSGSIETFAPHSLFRKPAKRRNRGADPTKERDLINSREEEAYERKWAEETKGRIKGKVGGRKSRVSCSNDYLGGSHELLGEGRKKLLESDNDPTAKHHWLLKKTRTERKEGRGFQRWRKIGGKKVQPGKKRLGMQKVAINVERQAVKYIYIYICLCVCIKDDWGRKKRKGIKEEDVKDCLIDEFISRE